MNSSPITLCLHLSSFTRAHREDRYPHVLQNTSAKLVASPFALCKNFFGFYNYIYILYPTQLDSMLPVILPYPNSTINPAISRQWLDIIVNKDSMDTASDWLIADVGTVKAWSGLKCKRMRVRQIIDFGFVPDWLKELHCYPHSSIHCLVIHRKINIENIVSITWIILVWTYLSCE